MSDSRDSQAVDNSSKGAVLGYFVPAPALPADELLSIVLVWRHIWRHKWLVGILGLLFGTLAYFGSLFQQTIYRAETMLAVVKSDQSASALSGVVGQLGGLAALAGIRPGGGSLDERIAFLNSRGLKRQFIKQFDLLPILFPEGWDSKTGRWIGSRALNPPTMEKAVRKFDEAVLQIDQDKVTSLIRLKCEWKDRDFAARWANDYVSLANSLLRQKAVQEASSSIAYLNTELLKTNSVELRQAIYRLIQEQMNSAMLSNVRQDYAFSVIDPASTPDSDRYVRPRPALYGALSALFGLLVGSLLALRRQRKNSST